MWQTMRQVLLFALLAGVLALAACNPERKAIQLLTSAVYVPVDPASMMPDVSASSGKIATVDDVKPKLTYHSVEGTSFAVGFTTTALIPANTAYVTMSAKQFLRAAAADPDAGGIILNPQSGPSPPRILKDRIEETLPDVGGPERMPLETVIKK